MAEHIKQAEKRPKSDLKDCQESSSSSQDSQDHEIPSTPTKQIVDQKESNAGFDAAWGVTVLEEVADLSVNLRNVQFVRIPCDNPEDSADDDIDSLDDSLDSDSCDECSCHSVSDTEEPSAPFFESPRLTPSKTSDQLNTNSDYWSRNGQPEERGPDVICFRGLEKLNGIARAIAETQRTNRLSDYAIVGPFSYVDVYSDPELEPAEVCMTADELEASVDPTVLEKYFNEFSCGADDDGLEAKERTKDNYANKYG
ncbi:uncharacterized protein LOC111248730 isoform X1 [Varroa destructor]|uniref:Uncharacterized protein n=1 Tax=Varroa destructor TaxID=109461 RepID=A0A7M7JUB1_VARDE|nr:uncharacterized protein LOC111248730 isoform X1 [Varroa destructor]XP_022657321.1 uncharacterized protein LOC111248730 isoform X1 [Varroa destructor]XP_022657322.1 uncharacterized protein LOC111248730 isoform X1 [Varroa destructor]XP_022657323.1 uncharacterized protein LOC111248730 isoform X1 [Varroa destructor]XP_022657324.1 uncharacterized protein LOC111248730 isoform X1 [Varroa destructor]